MARRVRLVQPEGVHQPFPVTVVRVHPASIMAAEFLCGEDQHVELNKDGSAMVVNGKYGPYYQPKDER